MIKQQAELKLIQQVHQDTVEVLFLQIRTLQHSLLDDLEKQYREKYARGPRVVILEDKTPAAVYNDKDGKGFPPSFNPDRDVIPVSTSRIITEWFREKREESDKKLDVAKAEFLKLQGHIQSAQQINAVVSDYIDSLINLKNKQNVLALTLTKKLAEIPGVGPIQTTVLDLLKIDTTELQKALPAPAK